MADNMEIDEQTKSLENKDLPLSLDILNICNDSRNTYGLRHQDYQRYRQFCAGKIHRLRKTVEFSHGKGRTFQKREINAENVKDSRFLHIILFNCERAWSYAMELKAEAGGYEEPRKHNHLIRRLRKAVQNAKLLNELCSPEVGKVDPKTSLEAQAYYNTMCGHLNFEQQSWEVALDKYAAARVIYGKLAATGTAHLEALCHAAIDGNDPSIRYCAYNLRLGDGNTNIDTLVESVIQKSGKESSHLDQLAAQIESAQPESRKKQVENSTSIEWRSKSIPIKNADLAVAILKIQDSDLELDSNNDDTILDSFDKTLALYKDTERLCQKIIKDDAAATAKVKSSKSEENTANVKFIFNYIVYHRHLQTLKRNLFLVRSIKERIEGGIAPANDAKPPRYQDLVKLYDNILQVLNELKEFLISQDEPALGYIIEAAFAYYRGVRCYNVALTYSKINKWAEAYALLERVQSRLVQYKSLRQAIPSEVVNDPELLIPESQVTDLEALVRGQKSKVHAAWYLQQGNEEAGITDKLSNMNIDEIKDDEILSVPLIENLDAYPEVMAKNSDGAPYLVDLPPKLQPVPCKPLFFDIAYNKIEYPSTLDQRAGKSQDAASRLGGFFGSLWGRS
ncbi:signal recognition particle subunit srp68 [Basidiobolus ranarum]|uniref:Signal recognition particle subunit SRP68 n=1 Tax=Basidiobolus ranarum TaxID=34480 RepID=A0ABR2WSQ1_9FUNG